MPSRSALAGFTLVELITSLVVIGVLVSLAAPELTSELRRARVRSALGEFTSDVYRARAYAAANGVRVTLALQPTAGCAAGYVLRRADTGALVRSVSLVARARGVCLSSNVARAMSINSRGMLVGSPRVVRAAAGEQRDSVSISIAGRIYRWQ